MSPKEQVFHAYTTQACLRYACNHEGSFASHRETDIDHLQNLVNKHNITIDAFVARRLGSHIQSTINAFTNIINKQSLPPTASTYDALLAVRATLAAIPPDEVLEAADHEIKLDNQRN